MRAVILILTLTLASCTPIQCRQGVAVQRARNPATGIWQLTVRCDGAVILTQSCSDGGARRIRGEREALLCDGAELVTYPAAAVTVVTQ